MKSILISIKPEWVAKILNGEKTIEIRKTMPNCELPIKCYIYCTKAKTTNRHLLKLDDEISGTHFVIGYYGERIDGRIVAEFTLNKVEELEKTILPTIPTCVYLTKTKRFASAVEKIGCLSQNEIYNYLGGKNGYAWYIDDLKIYDKPKELMQFLGCINCSNCNSYKYKPQNERFNMCNRCKEFRTITRPPQSWCYVEEE